MSVGRVIYYHRKKQNKTQEQLCQGICSITHLSKIENNSKEVNSETLELLCNRLGISIEEENKKTQTLSRKLTQFHEAMERLHRTHAETLKRELEEHKDFIQCTEMVYLFELYMLRYLLFTNNSSEFGATSQKLKKNINKYSAFEKYLWNFFQAIYYAQKCQFSNSLAIMDQIEDDAETYSGKVTDFYYFKAAVHGLLKHFTLSLHYSHKALQIFQNTGNIARILHVKIGLSANLIYINDLEGAETMLETAFHDAEMLKENDSKPAILHNFGLLNSKKGHLEEALNYFMQSLALKTRYTSSYYMTVIKITQILLELKEREKALDMLKDALHDFKDEQAAEYIELMTLYLEALSDRKRLTDYLINHALPMMKQYNLYKATTYAERLAEIFKQDGDTLSANEYLHLSNELLKKLLFNHVKSK